MPCHLLSKRVSPPPPRCCRRAIATALLLCCPPPPPCHCHAIVATLLSCCRRCAATDGCLEAKALAVPPLRCRPRHLCFYCPSHHRCHRAITATAIFLPPCCRAARHCCPTATLPAATMLPPPLPCRRRGCQPPPLPRHCPHCSAAATTAALLPP